jgi:hypothetical protein
MAHFGWEEIHAMSTYKLQNITTQNGHKEVKRRFKNGIRDFRLDTLNMK